MSSPSFEPSGLSSGFKLVADDRKVVSNPHARSAHCGKLLSFVDIMKLLTQASECHLIHVEAGITTRCGLGSSQITPLHETKIRL